MPLFSVIIPTKDRSNLLIEAIQSVLAQTYTDFELIVVDDHSKENILQLVSEVKDGRIKYAKNKGEERSAARNTGIDVAIGQYICFMDDDDLYKPDYLQDFYTYLSTHDFPKDVILRTGFEKLWEDGKTKKGINYDEKKHRNPVYFAAYNMCGVWCLCVPREYYLIYKFDERWPPWEDTHLTLRMLSNINFVQLESYNYQYRFHPQMGSKKNNINNHKLKEIYIIINGIKDYFNSHYEQSRTYLPTWTKSYLVAEKYLQYSILMLSYEKKRSFLLLKNSLSEGFYIGLWKYYIMYGITFFKTLISK